MVGTAGPRFSVSVDGREYSCVLRGRLKRERQNVTSLAVVGDRVLVTAHDDGSGAIEEVLPRRSELARPGSAGLARVIAANVDQLVIVQCAGLPVFNRHLVERFCALAERGRIAPLLVVNKSDLEPEPTLREWVAPMEASGVHVVFASARRGDGLPALRDALRDRISVLAGPSGVGKSSLLNALHPGLQIKTTDVSAATQRGRHTTSASRLYALPGGGHLVDTPGIRELGLPDDPEAIVAVFPEIAEAAVGCRFRSCTHSHEPACAVRDAVSRGEIHADRYQHFLRLRAGE